MLSIADLDTYYGDSHILRGAGLELPTGTALGLLGRNGMGKTTLIRTVMGYVRPARGRIAWDGKDVTGWAPERMARLGIGYVPEGRGIFPNLSVRENLLMSARAGVDGKRDGYWRGGYATPTVGTQDFRLILAHTGNDLTLLLPFGVDVTGLNLQIFAGCNHELTGDCANKFQNAIGELSRKEFESWIADDLARIAATADDAVERAGVAPKDITRVFMTGGSALVPAVRALFAHKFGAEKLVGGDEFSSVAQGLALMGLD